MNTKRIVTMAVVVALVALPRWPSRPSTNGGRRPGRHRRDQQHRRLGAGDRLGQGEVEVTGTLGRGTERLEFSGPPERILVKVVVPEHTATSRLRSHVKSRRLPARGETVSATLTVEG